MRRATFVLLVLWLSWLHLDGLLAQDMPTELRKKPDALVNPKVQDLNDYQVPWTDLEARKAAPWIVYSDRAKNPVLGSPGGEASGEKLGFLEPLYVVAEEGEYLQLLRVTEKPSGFTIPPNSQVVGWMHRDKLLHWDQGLLTPDGALSLRGVVQNKIDYAKGQRTGKANLVELLDRPSSQGKPLDEVRLNRFFYLYKVDLGSPEPGDEFVLLGRQHIFAKGEEARALVGWAPLSRLVIWNHRIALEPNWEEQAWGEREQGRKAVVLRDVGKAKAYAAGDLSASGGPLWNADPGTKRRPGEWKRFPVLSPEPETDQTILKVGVMGQVFSTENSSQQVASEDTLAQLQDRIDRLAAARQQVNLVFVVDGTRSFGVYYKPIVDAIRSTMSALEGTSQSQYRFGAVVYRDSQEVRERWLDVQPLGTRDAVTRFLPGKEYHQNDQTDAEAVNYGLRAALKLFSSHQDAEKQTNLIVLIGDAGNHQRKAEETFVPAHVLWEDFVRYNAHFLAVQVHRYSDPVYERFIQDQKELGGTVAMQVWTALRDQYPNEATRFSTPEWATEGDTFRLRGGPMRVEVHGQPVNGVMAPEALRQRVQALLGEIDQQNEALQKELLRIKDGGAAQLDCGPQTQANSKPGDAEPSLGCAVLEVLQSAGLTPNDIKVLQQEKFQLYTQGVVTLKVEGQQWPLFKRTLLIGRTELDNLRQAMEQLKRSKSGNQRKKLQEAWLTILQDYLGTGSPEELGHLTLAEVNTKIFGLPGTTAFLKEVKLEDITNPASFPDEKLSDYTTRIAQAHQRFYDLGQHPENDPACFDTQEEAQCWIDEDVLP